MNELTLQFGHIYFIQWYSILYVESEVKRVCRGNKIMFHWDF